MPFSPCAASCAKQVRLGLFQGFQSLLCAGDRAGIFHFYAFAVHQKERCIRVEQAHLRTQTFDFRRNDQAVGFFDLLLYFRR